MDPRILEHEGVHVLVAPSGAVMSFAGHRPERIVNVVMWDRILYRYVPVFAQAMKYFGKPRHFAADPRE